MSLEPQSQKPTSALPLLVAIVESWPILVCSTLAFMLLGFGWSELNPSEYIASENITISSHVVDVDGAASNLREAAAAAGVEASIQGAPNRSVNITVYGTTPSEARANLVGAVAAVSNVHAVSTIKREKASTQLDSITIDLPFLTRGVERMRTRLARAIDDLPPNPENALAVADYTASFLALSRRVSDMEATRRDLEDEIGSTVIPEQATRPEIRAARSFAMTMGSFTLLGFGLAFLFVLARFKLTTEAGTPEGAESLARLRSSLRFRRPVA